MVTLILITVLAVYAVYLVAGYLLQDRMLFPREYAGKPDPLLVPGNVVELTRQVDGVTVTAWLVRAPVATPETPAPLMQYFHGNGELMDHQDEVLLGYSRMGVSVLQVEYRGYGRSGGVPSQAALTDDAIWFLDQVIQRPEVDAARIILHGRSVGTGVAGQVLDHLLDEERPPHAVVLDSPFTSITAMAWRMGFPPFVVRHPFRTDRVLPHYDGPVLINHGSADEVIPFHHGQRLAELAPNARFVAYPDASHNTLPPNDQRWNYWQDIEAVVGE